MNEPAREPQLGSRIGSLAGGYAFLCLLIAGASLFVSARNEALLVQGILDRAFAWQLGSATLLVLVLQLALGALVARAQLRRQRHAVGRARLLVLAMGGASHAVGAMTALAVLMSAAKPQDLVAGFGVTLPPAALGVAAVSSGIAACGLLASSGAAFSTWLLVSDRTRARVWVVVDLALLAATVLAAVLLPSQPASAAARDLVLPIVRHAITTAFSLRLLTRLLPSAMNMIERIGFRWLIAARHLRAKKSGFLAAISLLSILAVTVSSCALTTTLSVMGGFRNDLKRKILGNNAHIVVDREHKSIEPWEPVLQATRDTPGIAGASPYVNGEVMLSSATNLATAVLRGIDPSDIGTVNDLPHNLKTGKLDYLNDPAKLLDLPPEAGSSLLSIQESLRKGESKLRKAGDGKSASGPASQATTEEKLDALEKRLEELDAFLREGRQSDKSANRDVLPGIIIGQELARALRLYLGDEVNVVAPLGALGPSGPMPKARPFRVAGIFYSGMYEYDMKFTYVALPTAQQFLNIGDAISGIDVKVHDVDGAPAIATSLRHRLAAKALRVRDWQELNSRLFGALALEKLAMFIALGIAILVASFCIAGTLTLMVQEKGREVAILKAMGTSDQAIVSVFVIEGGLIGLLGAALGLFLGYMMCFAAEHFGIRMNPEVYYIDRLPVYIDPAEFALTGIASVLVCLLVTIYPALMASRLRPLDALRYE